jgi:mannose-6-phosphate isomerase-like protein (cupin superfamily)
MRAEKILIEHPREESEYYFKEGCYILELLNHESDPESSIARARVTAGEKTRWHHLIDTTERYVILEGKGQVEVGAIKESVGQGDIVVIPAETRQRIVNTGTTDLIFLAICSPRFNVNNYTDLEMPAE